MANPEHLEILNQGSEVWNEWRKENEDVIPNLNKAHLRDIDLRGANLKNVDLDDAELHSVDLEGANLARASLIRANLTNVNLSNAFLYRANLTQARMTSTNLDMADLSRVNFNEADLRHTSLIKTNLVEANFLRANLKGAKLSQAVFQYTQLEELDLSQTIGLDSILHYGNSYLSGTTLEKSGPLPLEFLRGCGLKDWEIEMTKLYEKDLSDSQVSEINQRIFNARTGDPIQHHSCFISHSHQDEILARKIYNNLDEKGVRCWYAPEDLKTGDRTRRSNLKCHKYQ